LGGECPHEVARRFESSPTCSTSCPMGGNALCHLGIARFGGCYIGPGWWERRNQTLRVTTLARASGAEDERWRGHGRGLRWGPDMNGAGMTCPIRAVNPTPTIAAPARRGMGSEISNPRQRANSAVPTVSALWIRTSPTRYA